MKPRALGDVGEFGLIEAIRARIPRTDSVPVGPGDDAAALVPGDGALLATTDMLVEGVHFDLSLSEPADAGRKSLLASLSDIAAMGGIPRFALMALGAPAAAGLSILEGIRDGYLRACEEFGVAAVGGDVVGAPALIVCVTVLGSEGPAGIVRRSGARAGDALCVTGPLGAPAAGLGLLRAARDGDAHASALLDRHPGLAAAHRHGRARVREGVQIARAGASAMIDVSDGVAGDARRIAEESGGGVEVDAARIPLAPGVAEAAAHLGADPLTLALRGGEEYELLFTIAPPLPGDLGAVEIGRVVESGCTLLLEDGTRAPLGAGYEHFGGPA